MRLKQQKCAFLLPEVEYLGHRITLNGLHPTPTKVKAITEAPAPRSVPELKIFLGLMGDFLATLLTVVQAPKEEHKLVMGTKVKVCI